MHWTSIISNDAHKFSTRLKNSFTCYADEKGEHWLKNCFVLLVDIIVLG